MKKFIALLACPIIFVSFAVGFNLKAPINSKTICYGEQQIKKASKESLKDQITRLQSESKEITGGDYYKDISSSLKGKNLLSALNKKISKHTNVGYDGLYTVYQTSDIRPDDTIWDFYGDFSFTMKDKAGSYKNEGDCFNREHSVPQSWFEGTTDSGLKKCDAFHVVPTDGKINGVRGNYPFGEVGTTNYTYQVNHQDTTGIYGINKRGSSSFSGYSGIVFEPMDCYKGDFARSVFYFATCYEGDATNSEGNSVFSKNLNNLYLTEYAKNLFLKWHHKDPVSYKEKARNEAIYAEQNNRNPFIDNPSYVDAIWGNGTINTDTKILNSIYIEGTLIKSSYKEGEKFDPVGLKVYAELLDEKGNETKEEITEKVTRSPSSLTSSTSYVRASYTLNGITKTADYHGFTVNILQDLYYEGSVSKTIYNEGEYFNPNGLRVYAKYSDREIENVTNYISWSPSPLIKGTTKVIGTYGSKTIEINGITVNEPLTTKIEITFKKDGSNSGTLLSSSTLMNYVESGKEYINSFTEVEKVYPGDLGIKLGSSKGTGGFVINFSSKVPKKASKIQIKCSKYSSDSSTLRVLATSTGGAANIQLTQNDQLLTLNTDCELPWIKVETTSKRAYVSSIIIEGTNGASPGIDPQPDNPVDPGTDEPDNPVNPDEPGTENPQDPVNPDNPDNPQNPIEPGNDNPDDPVNPDEPGTDEPLNPQNPDDPGNDEPQEPTNPDTPGADDPAEPTIPSEPTEPQNPDVTPTQEDSTSENNETEAILKSFNTLGCGGSIISTSAIISTLSLSLVGLAFYKKKKK